MAAEIRTTSLPRRISERDVMRHIAWLASERRHTTIDDIAFRYASERGWCEELDGVMSLHPRMFRVRLTDEGIARMAMPEQLTPADVEYLSWGASL